MAQRHCNALCNLHAHLAKGMCCLATLELYPTDFSICRSYRASEGSAHLSSRVSTGARRHWRRRLEPGCRQRSGAPFFRMLLVSPCSSFCSSAACARCMPSVLSV